MLWSVGRNELLLKVKCGGGHRAWDFTLHQVGAAVWSGNECVCVCVIGASFVCTQEMVCTAVSVCVHVCVSK